MRPLAPWTAALTRPQTDWGVTVVTYGLGFSQAALGLLNATYAFDRILISLRCMTLVRGHQTG